MKKIICYPSPSGSRIYRMEQIAKYVNRLPNYRMVISPNATNDEELMWADIVFVQGLIDPMQLATLWAYKMERGKKIITDRDDLMEAQDDNPAKKINTKTHATSWTKELLKICDLVTVTTQTIKDEVKKYNKNVHILPNYLDMEVWDIPTSSNDSDMIRIGWAGSISHRDDLEMIMPVIRRILEERENVKFVFCGDPFVISLLGGIHPKKYQYVDGIANFLRWPNLGHTLALDIAIAPLTDTRFNWGRSYLKYLEYGMFKAAGVYSHVAYKDAVKHGQTGYIAENPHQWYTYLNTLIDYKYVRDTIREEAYNDVRTNHSISKHITDWVKLYKAL